MISGAAAVCLMALGVLLFAEEQADARLKWIAKPAASLAFVALAYFAGALETTYGQLILAGLVLCLAGDVFLIPRAKGLFLAGMGAFALGHLAYLGAFATIWSGFGAGAIIATVVLTGFVFIVLRQLWPHLNEFRIPVAVYCLIITAMAATSFGTQSPAGGSPYWLVVAGAVGFAISDIAVARDQFYRREFFNRLWGLPLYYGSQLLLAASV